MSTRRLLISGLVLAVLGWFVWVAFSLLHVGDSLPDLTSFDLPSVQTPASKGPALAAPVDFVQPPVEISSSADATVDAPAAIELSLPEEAAVPKAVTAWQPWGASQYEFFGTDPTLERRCRNFEVSGVFVPETVVHPDVLGGLSAEELKALVDSREEDGNLQRLYAQSLRAAAREPRPLSRPSISLNDDATMREYDLRAIRGRHRESAAELVVTYYRVDKVESNAWWRILREMGFEGTLAMWIELRGHPPYTDQESRDGADRADELINELELLSGLGVPEECLTPDEIVEQRGHLAELVRRLARRAMPSASPDEPPRAFNRLNSHALVVENVCLFSCPRDVQRVIYYEDVPDTDACSQLDGVQRTIQARMPTGRLEERTFCVPAFLAEN